MDERIAEKRTYQREDLAVVKKGEISISVEMSRAEFDDGARLGKPMLSLIVRNGERFLRFNMDRNPSEAVTLRDVLEELDRDHIEGALHRFYGVFASWEADMEAFRKSREDRGDRDDNRGNRKGGKTGLGRFEAPGLPGKTERKKGKRGGNRTEQDGNRRDDDAPPPKRERKKGNGR